MDSKREEAEARPSAEGAQQRGRGRLTVRGVLEILAEQAPHEAAREGLAEAGEEDLRAVLAFESGEPVVRGVVR
jgi:hypothetical protein